MSFQRASTISAVTTVKASIYDLEFLRQQARWIRDDLDPQVARDGPDVLHSDDILTLDELLRRLLASDLPLEDVRYSRLDRAVGAISGQATRWPKKLIEKSDALKRAWEEKFGVKLRSLHPPLYESGGRLHGIARAEDLSKEKTIVRWIKTPGVKLSPALARRTGALGFTPGDWWISPIFAFRDGIIDFAEPSGGIVADANGAYALLMVDDEEVDGPSGESFRYRTKANDVGRYRLTAATRESRQPIRILRSHSLRSFWSPRAGVRYDGLHKVIGWVIQRDQKTKEIVYEITFQRLPTELSMDIVLRRPFCDEVEDYLEYKMLRQEARKKQEAAKDPVAPTARISVDGVWEEAEDSGNEEDSEKQDLPARIDCPQEIRETVAPDRLALSSCV